jgi:N-formylglutamate amidohydrolase
VDLRRRLAALVAAIALLLAHSAAAAGIEDLVLKQPGSLPIILTAPHGGTQAIPGVSARVVAGKGDRYNAGRDPETDRLAIGIAAEIKALTGKDVYLVLARFDRKFIDANRPPEVAFDNPAAAPITSTTTSRSGRTWMRFAPSIPRHCS